jgi:hypothetical protein
MTALARLLACLLAVAIASPSAGAARATRPAARKQIVKPRRVARPPVRRRATRTALRSLERGNLALLRSIAGSDPFVRAEMDAVLADADRLIAGAGAPSDLSARRAWVPLVSARPLRRAVVRTILRDMNSRSERLKTAIRGAGDAAVWDTVFLGAGIHTAAAASALGQAAPSHSMLVIEAGEVVSSNFASLGETIAINSSNRRETGQGILPFSDGNNNPAVGPVGVPDVSGEKWPAADALSDVATVSLHTSGADVLTRSAVLRVSERPAGERWPARYRIETADGLTVYAASVVVGSGLGRPSIKVDRGAELIARETGRVDLRRPDDVPGILYYSQAMALANQSAAPRDPYRAAPGKRPPRIAVIGGADSGRTVLELMYGLAPGNAYDGPGKLDRAQRGEIGDLDWVVGPDGPTDCKSFLDRTRARYARIAPSIKTGRARLVNRRFVGVARAGKRYRVYYDDGSSAIYDRIVLATGFESQVPDILSPILPADRDPAVPLTKSPAVAVVKRPVREKNRPVARTVAKQVVGHDVYLIGPAAGDDLVPRKQITGPPMLAAIKFLVPYSAALAREVLPATRARAPRLDPRVVDQRTRIALGAARGRAGAPRRIRRSRVAEPDDPASDPARTGIEPLVLKHEMATVLDEFSYGRLQSVSLTVRPARGGLQVSSAELDDAAIQRVRDAIEQNYALVRMLDKFARVGKSVSFTASTRGELLDPATLTMTY